MKILGENRSFIILLLAILIVVCEKIEGATTETCVPQYGFLPCTSGIWGTLFLVVVYQYLMSIGQGYISDGSNKFFGLVGPGIFGASLFHILGNFPMLYIVLESRLSSDDTGAAASAAMGMSVLAGSAVMSLTLVWPSVIAFGSYDLADDNDDDTIIIDVSLDEPSFLSKLTAYGVTTDIETSYTARLMLISMIPFLILLLPNIINSDSVTRVIVLIALIISLSFFFAYIVYQIFQPWIQNRRFDYETQKFVKNKLLKLLSTNGKPNVQLIKELYKGLDKNHDSKVTSAELKTLLLGIQVQADGQLSDDLVNRIMDQIDVTGDEIILEDEFVKVIKKWLQDARKSLSKNDYNPLSFFVKPVPAVEDEEQQAALIPKTTTTTVNVVSSIWDYLEAFAMIAVGIVIAVLIARPLIMNVANFATLANVPSFLIPYFVIPCAIGIQRLISTISSASQKTQRAASLTLSQIYAGVFMSNMSSLSTFLLTIYIKDVPWDVSAEVLVVFIICVTLGIFTSTRTVIPLWTAYVGYLFYPISILMLYLLTAVWGWS